MLKRILFLSVLALTAFSVVNIPPVPPPGAIAPYLNGVFSEKIPGASGAWKLEDAWPDLNIPAPLRILPFPGSEDVLVLTKFGEVWRVSLESQSQQLVLDLKDRAFEGGEAGTTGIALHPQFGDPDAPDKQLVFIFYRHKPPPTASWTPPWDHGFNRLSKFRWNKNTGAFDRDTEEILFQQYDRNTWHNGGGMFFHPDDGFLYLALGDEGDPEFVNIEGSTQLINRAFMSGVLRIDVDNDPNKSHPIRRQPQPVEWGPVDPAWGDTYSQGYSIPNDNPWQDSEGGILEEFFALGVRSPYSFSYDEADNRMWLSDVGYITREEISIVEKGDNLQWPFMEGDTLSEILSISPPANLIGEEKAPIHAYRREFGGCIIGGNVYRGPLFPDLYGKFLFADYNNDRIVTLAYDEETQEVEREVLIYNIETQGIDLPAGNGISGVFPLPNGEVLVTVLGQVQGDFRSPGKILRLSAQEITPDPPALLSELGVFTDMTTLEVADGIIPYAVNSPLWSDGAVKRRWMAIPNDGIIDSPSERIKFDRIGDWGFPEGTVFIKHFELPVDAANEVMARLETRFFILGKDGAGYGLTYRWNEEGTDATLLQGSAKRTFTLYDNGIEVGSQVWTFPGREQCLSCHTPNANYVLGVKTHQLNGTFDYPEIGSPMNQLTYLSEAGLFSQPVSNPDNLLRAYAIDDESVALEIRIRSYLDANCSSCHRLGGVTDVNLDFRFQLPLHLQNIINHPTLSSNSDPNRMIVKPGDHENSEIWVRDASLNSNQMPPLARAVIDEVYIENLVEWIGSLSEDAGKINELVLYPNPTFDWLGIRISDEWEGPFKLEVYNVNGQQIRSLNVDTHAYFLDMGNAVSGTYVLSLSGKNKREVRKFIVR
jgi:uncharacterized repeat protein (TIGR03806 family)